MNEPSRNKSMSMLALAVALTIPGFLPQSAHGMYDPKHGRWLQRDPDGTRAASPQPGEADGESLDPEPDKQYADGMHLYQYATSNPGAKNDPDGLASTRPPSKQMTMILENRPPKSDCGSFMYRWKFKLPKKAPCEGLIVQHVRASAACLPTSGTEVDLFNDMRSVDYLEIFGEDTAEVEYWEKWDVPKGATIVDHDEASWPSFPGQMGYMIQTGEARFFCKGKDTWTIPAITGIVGAFPRCPGYRGRISSGVLMHTTKEPPWWDRYRKDIGVARRTARSRWHCCKGLSRGFRVFNFSNSSASWSCPKGVCSCER